MYFTGSFQALHMEQQEDKYVKVLFRFHSNVLDEETVETIWATTIDPEKGHYRIDNIPFYVPELACGDIVFAEYDDDEGRLTYRETVEYSGNSTVQVVIMDHSKNPEEIRKLFEEMGCESEGTGSSYFVMDIPADLDYYPVKLKLQQLSDAGVLDYAEPSLSAHHQY